MYTALVDHLAPDLIESSRADGKYAQHQAFGEPGQPDSQEYYVEFDIASCYEYLDHAFLRRELLLSTTDVSSVDVLIDLLGEIMGRSRGLPQMMDSSDTLADTYLEGISRHLARLGYSISRYADDFKILAKDWGTANTIIEEAAEISRTYGLILSTEKTAVYRSTNLIARKQERATFLNNHVESARSALTVMDEVWEYNDFELVAIEPDVNQVAVEAMRKIVVEWSCATR